jgi:hypothetical protein
MGGLISFNQIPTIHAALPFSVTTLLEVSLERPVHDNVAQVAPLHKAEISKARGMDSRIVSFICSSIDMTQEFMHHISLCLKNSFST